MQRCKGKSSAELKLQSLTFEVVVVVVNAWETA